eukprot:298507-Ditylum_brightwellii.AAC.1
MAGSLLPAPHSCFNWLGITILVYHCHSRRLTFCCRRCHCHCQLLAVAANSCLLADILFNGSATGQLSSLPPAVPNVRHCQH